MSARSAYRVPDRRGGGPQGGRNKGQVHRNGPGRVEMRFFKLEKATDESPQLKEASLENWELALTLLS